MDLHELSQAKNATDDHHNQRPLGLAHHTLPSPAYINTGEIDLGTVLSQTDQAAANTELQPLRRSQLAEQPVQSSTL